MTDKTATQNLTRTTSGDDPREMATYLKTLATETDLRMAAQFYDLGRAQSPPLAALRITSPVVYDGGQAPPIVWDTVVEDTSGLVDLSSDPTLIVPNEPGWWAFGGYVQTTGFGSANSDTTLSIGGATNSTRDGGLGLSCPNVAGMFQVTTPGVLFLSSYVSWTGSSTSSLTTIYYGEMWCYKVRDL